MNQQRNISDYELFGTNFGFCGNTCKLDKHYCADCLFNYCSEKHKIGILLDSDLMFKDEVELCGLISNELFKYNFNKWLNCIDDIFVDVNEWIIENLDIAKENYFEMLKKL